MRTEINLDFSMDAIKKESFERGKRAGQKEFKKMLNDVITDILSLPTYYAKFSDGEIGIHIDKNDVLNIINKHISESEEKNGLS